MSRLWQVSATIGIALSFCVGLAATPAPAAAADNVLQVVAVSVNPGQMENYMAKVKQLNGILTRLEANATMRAWQATLAGENTGTVVIGLEFPNMAAFADTTTKIRDDAEWNKLVSGLDSMRKLLSTSLYQEITP